MGHFKNCILLVLVTVFSIVIIGLVTRAIVADRNTDSSISLESGVIYDLEHVLEHTEIQQKDQPRLVTYGKYVVTTMQKVPVTVFIDDMYIVYVKESSSVTDAELKRTRFLVTEEYYNSVKVGDTFVYDNTMKELK